MRTPVATNLKLDTKTKARLQLLADARQRPAHLLVREAVEQYLEREEQRDHCFSAKICARRVGSYTSQPISSCHCRRG